jgi:hypothetical protein
MSQQARNNPDSPEMQAATRQNEREVFALQMMAQPDLTILNQLTVGMLVNTDTHGVCEYLGPDDYMGERTLKFRNVEGYSELIYWRHGDVARRIAAGEITSSAFPVRVSVWRTDKPDAELTVLMRLDGLNGNLAEEPVWPGYTDGERWFYADGSEVIAEKVIGWMETVQAAKLLDTSTF